MGLKRVFLLALLTLCLMGMLQAPPARAQDEGKVVGTPFTGEAGLPVSVADLMKLQAVSPPEPMKETEEEVEWPDRTHLPQNPASPALSRFSDMSTEIGKSLPGGNQIESPQTVGLSWTAATLSGTNPTSAFPPDCMGAVGPTQYFAFENNRLVTFNKTTGVADGVINVTSNTFFNSVRNASSTSDPRIRYDRLTGRWFLLIINVSIPNRILIAVSDAASAGVITGSTVFTYFYIPIDTTPPTISNTCLADYPALGLDANALYIGVNDFCNNATTFNGTDGFVVRKSSILGAGPIVVTAFRQLGPASGAGLYTPQGVDNFDPAATEGYFIGVDNNSYGLLQVRRVSSPGGTPTISGNLSVTVPTTTGPISVAHLGNTGGSNGKLDALDDRLFAAHVRNGRLWTAHNIQVNASGVASSSGGRDGSRWYELNVPVGSGTPTVVQSGTIYDPAASNPLCYWIPSVMVSGQGHAAFSFGSAGVAARANCATVGRLVGDAAGSTGTVALITSSSTAYNPSSDPGSRGARRWGDYSYVSVDPLDDQTMWAVHMFCDATNSYGVRVTKLIAPLPATPSVLADITAGQNPVNLTLTGVSSSGSGFWDPGTNLPGVPAFSHLAAAVTNGGATGTPPTVVSATYVDATTVNLVLNAASATANIGSEKYTITITNPDGQTAAAAVVHVISSALGACCTTAGACSQTLQANCASPSTWNGSWTACSPNPCPQPGACCNPSTGACTLVLQSACVTPLTWNGGSTCSPNPCPQLGACCTTAGACSQTLQANCASPSTWNGSWTTCTPNPCPQPGACCNPSTGACTLVLQTACVTPLTWNGGSTCSPNPCPQLGACCTTAGACSQTLQANCASPSTWNGSWTTCTPNPCPQPGACCNPSTGACTMVLQIACVTPLTWNGGSTCSPNPCPQLGACCTTAGACSQTLQANCASPSTWNGSWTTCTPNPCPQPGACCNPSTGACTMVLQIACVTPLTWNGGSTCSPNPCPQLGACCTTAGACTLTLQANCASPSTWNGIWTACTPNPCPQPGACCDPSTAACILVLQTACASPLIWNGSLSCSPNPCPQPSGACCDPATGGCALTLQADCHSPNTWQGGLTVCTPNPCPEPPAGACCDPSAGGCTVTIQVDCASPGIWHSEWTSCTPNPCPQPSGACCDPATGGCALTTLANCPSPSVWHAEWTGCTPNPCPPPVGACCDPATGGCTLAEQSACAVPGVWHSEWTNCSPNPCPQLGACCDGATSACTVTLLVDCAEPSIWYTGVTCTPDPCVPAAVAALAMSTKDGFIAAVPNPFFSSVAVWYGLRHSGPALLEFIDATGRIVKRLANDGRQVGVHSMTWNGQDETGKRLPAGVYLIRVTTAKGKTTGRAILLR